MPDDVTSLFPLAAETPESILARMQNDLNAGISPSDPLYADILPGSVWDDMARADTLEMDRLYDRMLSEVPAAALPGGATGGWLDLWASAVNLQRKAATLSLGVVRFTGPDGVVVGTGTQVSTEAPTPDADPVTFEVTASGTIAGGAVDLAVAALSAGSQGDVPANSVTQLNTPIDGVTVSNPAAITGGSDVESDELLQARVLAKLRGTSGAGNVDYYVNLALNFPGIGFVTVQPNTPSIGHVTIMISDMNGAPASTALIAAFQAQVDPSGSAGQGAGLAAVGATVIVTTPAATAIALAATIVPDTGYSVTGAGGTISLAPDITAAVGRYFAGLGVGDDVIHNKVLGAIVNVEGVADVSALTLNGGAGDVAIDATHTAELTLPITLS